jgi:hypothetical protein
MRDAELARKLKRSMSSVRSRRNDNTSIRFIQTPKRWTRSELRLLGRLPDAEIARRSRRFWHRCVTSGCGLASRVLCQSVDLCHPASVGMLAMESGAFPKWSELRNEGSSEAPEPRSQRKPPLIQQSKIPLVTSTRFAQRKGRGREGERADGETVERAKRVLVTAG